MTERKRRDYDWTWTTLRDLVYSDGGFHTAGEVGRVMGISRNTAKKYLDELIKTGTVVSKDVTGANWQTWKVYRHVEPSDELGVFQTA